jgi:hypothetical protein
VISTTILEFAVDFPITMQLGWERNRSQILVGLLGRQSQSMKCHSVADLMYWLKATPQINPTVLRDICYPFPNQMTALDTEGNIPDVLELEIFVEYLNGALAKSMKIDQPDARLVEDLGCDSLDMLLALDVVAELASLEEIDPGLLAEIPITVRDLHLLYLSAIQFPHTVGAASDV